MVLDLLQASCNFIFGSPFEAAHKQDVVVPEFTVSSCRYCVPLNTLSGYRKVCNLVDSSGSPSPGGPSSEIVLLAPLASDSGNLND